MELDNANMKLLSCRPQHSEVSGMSFQRIYASPVANNQQLKEASKLFWKSLNQIRSMQNRTAAHLETISTYV
jgi:hypothetical protein